MFIGVTVEEGMDLSFCAFFFVSFIYDVRSMSYLCILFDKREND